MIVRPSRPFHSQSRLLNRRPRAALVAASVASVLLGMSVSFDAFAQASDAAGASAPVAASESAGAFTQYSVKPGQSLGDIATQITGSTDRATREKMARAIFDANPNAFMGHDPSRLKLGSVLNVPSLEDAGVASGASASGASSTAVQASSPETAAAPVVAASNAVGAATVAGASGAVTQNAASEVNAAAPTSEAQPTASASESASASAPLPAASSAPAADVAPSTTSSVPASGNGPIGWLIGVVVAIGLLLFAMRAAKRRRAAPVAADDDRETQETPVLSTAPEATGAAIHHSATSHAHSHPATGAADLDSASVQRDQSELNVVAASMENYDAAQSFDTPTADAPVPPAIDDDGAAGTPVALDERGNVEHRENREQQAVNPPRDADAKRAPFMPEAPAARHPDFTPPRPGAIEAALAAERAATERAAALRAEMEAREQEVRDAAALELATREAAAREAAARETEAKEAAAREAEAREAEAREVEARETAARETAAREAAAREAEAREAEARETAAREAASHEASEHQPTPSQPTAPESAAHSAPNESNGPHDPTDPSAYDDEPSPASRFPQPKFPQEAIEALSALEFGLPPRQEVPAAPAAPTEVQPAAPADHAPPPHVDGNQETQPDTAPIAPAPVTPQPIADPAVFDRQNEQHRHPESTSTSASEQIESGTAGAASVAGLGASRFGPLSLDFDYNSPASQSEPLPAFTPEQISTIARNKLELAVEYIELGDLSGARTLLQEVIESNDRDTRQPAATLLSTLAPLS
jgi:pilus assembly protein FimV